MLVAPTAGGGTWDMDSPGASYGGGHNNDSAVVD